MSNNRGSSLIAVLSIAVILNLVLALVFVTVKNTQVKTGTKRSNTVVLSIAEAGKEHALSLFRSGSTSPVAGRVIDMINSESFGGGVYSVKCSSNVAIDTIYLRSYAEYVNSKCSIEVVCSVVSCAPPDDSAYNYGLVAGGGINWTGSGSCNTGSARLHSNGTFRMAGSSDFTCNTLSTSGNMTMSGAGSIYGNVHTPNLRRSGSGTISGTTTIGAVPTVAIPVLDFNPYYEYALANGQVYSGRTITGSASVTIPGGVLWVDGDFRYSGSGDIHGSIIATGDIKISGSGNFYRYANCPAIASVSGDIDMSGSGNVTGLIFAQVGGIDKSGSGDVIGSLICGGTLDKSGSWNTLTYINSAPVPPGCTGAKYTEIGWREL